jgi:regulator of sigma D
MRNFVNMHPKSPYTKLHNKELNHFCSSQYYSVSHFKVDMIGDSCNKHERDWKCILILTEIFDSNRTLERELIVDNIRLKLRKDPLFLTPKTRKVGYRTMHS